MSQRRLFLWSSVRLLVLFFSCLAALFCKIKFKNKNVSRDACEIGIHQQTFFVVIHSQEEKTGLERT